MPQLEYRELLESLPDGIVVVDDAGTIILVNLQAEKMFGYPRAELLGQRIEVLIPHRHRARHPAHMTAYTGDPHTRPMGSGLELSGLRRDGTEFPLEISLSPIRHKDRIVVSAAIRDVSDRREIEAVARRANAFLLSAVDSINDAFVLYDEADRVVMVNTAFREMFPVNTGGTVVGMPFESLIDALIAQGLVEPRSGGDDGTSLRDRWVTYHREPRGAMELHTQRGRTLRVVDRLTAEHGRVSIMLDVTEDQRRADELRRAREQAEAASAAKSEFLSSMSHELRTPLNAVLGFAQLLQRDKKEPLSARQLERIVHVVRGGEHLLKLIDEVLDLSRIEAGRISFSPEPVSVSDVLQEVATTLEPMAQRIGVTMATLVPQRLEPVQSDRTRLAQILMNFGSNAIKYNRSGGRVVFEVERRDTMVRVTVVDDGIGIPEDKRARIFEPFHRAGQETGPIQGTGIGLAISKRLAELMHGRVGFTSETDRGSRFWVEMPIASEHQLAPTTARTPRPVAPSAEGRRHLVVYVEDNPSNIVFMRGLVDDMSGIELVTAPTAEIGLDIIRARQPAAVIMDINLPGMDGIEATRRLAQMPETKHIPVIALTAAALSQDVIRANDAGFYRYLTKPVKVDELTAALQELLAS